MFIELAHDACFLKWPCLSLLYITWSWERAERRGPKGESQHAILLRNATGCSAVLLDDNDGDSGDILLYQ